MAKETELSADIGIHAINLEGETISYTLLKRNVRYPRLDYSDGELFVIVPEKRKCDVEKLLNEKKRWVLKNHSKIGKWMLEHDSLIGENAVMLFGKRFELRESLDRKPRIDKLNSILFCSSGTMPRVRRILKQELLDRIGKLVEKHSLPINAFPRKIIIRNLSSKWGACSSLGNISFNIKAICLSDEILEYLVVHEMVHLRIRNHSGKFYSEVKGHVPEMELREKELKKHWFMLQKSWKRLF